MIPKFRAFIKLENSVNPMQTVAKINFEKESVTIEQGLVFKFNDVELMQSTGLKDKNGVEFYEGDVVEAPSSKARYLVDYVEGCFLGRAKHREYTKLYKRLEVIGNIYEKPELLEVAE